MEARQFQKLKMLYLVDILNRYTDEDHPMSANAICEKLATYGVSAERKAIYDDIEMLIMYGYDIIKTRTPRFGYFMASRNLELPEIYMLSDAVRSADFITPKKTRELITKLDNMLSVSQAASRDKGIYIDSIHKCKNEEIYYSIDNLSKAIAEGKKITLRYCQRLLLEGKKIETKEKPMLLSPYALIWENDHYYLVCNNEKYDNLLHLRLDRIKKVEITEAPYRHFSEVSRYTDTFDVADYTAKAFNMYGGVLQKIELKCKKEKLEQIIDRFSDNIMIYSVTENTFNFSTEAMISDGFIAWILQFGTDVEVLSPHSLRSAISEKVRTIGELYAL